MTDPYQGLSPYYELPFDIPGPENWIWVWSDDSETLGHWIYWELCIVPGCLARRCLSAEENTNYCHPHGRQKKKIMEQIRRFDPSGSSPEEEEEEKTINPGGNSGGKQ